MNLHRTGTLLLLLATAALSGCQTAAEFSPYMTPDRKENGLVVILPGIEGVSGNNLGIRKGIVNSGLNWAVTIYPWGRPVPLVGMALNQMDVVGNRLAARGVAEFVVQYKQSYPGRPVWLIGHSGGGGIAVFAAEAMPPGEKVDGCILLSASIYHRYDLTRAMRGTERIVNFYNPSDRALLEIGTTLTSNVDGSRGPSAGLRGFARSVPGLRQVAVTGTGDPHTAAVRPAFVRQNVVPYIRRHADEARLAAQR